MIRKVSLVSAAVLVAACSSGGESTENDGAMLPGTPPHSSTANSAPTVMSTQIRVQLDGDLSETIAATDADGDTVSFVLVDGPDWISLSSDGVLTGTPSTENLGGFELVIDVSDGEDTNSRNDRGHPIHGPG